jgi:hypothetical protein
MQGEPLVSVWKSGLQNAWDVVFFGVLNTVPKVLVAIIIFLVGWLLGSLLAKAVSHAIKAAKIDNALKQAGLEDLVHRAGFSLDSGRFVGTLVQWFIIAVFLLASMDVLGLGAASQFLNQVIAYIPSLIVAVLIILIAAVIAQVAEGVVVGSARAAGVKGASFSGTLVKWAIWITAILAAMDHLGVAAGYASTLFTGIVVALSIAVGLAFGLGGQQAAADLIEKVRKDIREK